jgi:hypothetical protein
MYGDVTLRQEDVVSTLAQKLWMSDPQYAPFIKKCQALVEVKKGVIFFPIVVNLGVLGTFEAFYLTLSTRYPKHDLCRARTLVMRPKGETGVSLYKEACAKDLSKEGCSSGLEPACECLIKDDCAEGRILLHVYPTQRERGAVSRKYYLDLLYAIATSADRTCGGVPWYKSPHGFSTGIVCSNDQQCKHEDNPLCSTTERGCLCCANLNVTCTSHDDCAKVEFGSLCGCAYDGLANTEDRVADKTNGQCGPWVGVDAFKYADVDKSGTLTNLELNNLIGFCRDSPSTPDCEELFFGATRPLECLQCKGTPCTYQGAGSRSCIHPLAMSNGTVDITVLEPLTSRGSRLIEFYGRLFDVNKALGAMQYLTNKNYNRLSREPLCYPPPLDKLRACTKMPTAFDPTTNDVDTLLVRGNDLGNSGGLERDIKIVERSMAVVSEAVNDRPRISAPMEVMSIEDWPFSFINTKLIGLAGVAFPQPQFYSKFVDAQCFFMQRMDGTLPPVDLDALPSTCGCSRYCDLPVHTQFSQTKCKCFDDDCNYECDTLQNKRLEALMASELKPKRGRIAPGIQISDPDYLDFGFAFLPIQVNISVQNGVVMLNEAFLTQKGVFDVRIKVRSFESFSANTGPDTKGLYHVPAPGNTACALCVEGWVWKEGKTVCCDVSPCRSCPRWGNGDKFVSIEGVLHDVNLALSNLTYVNTPHFNTRFGSLEAILIEVSDKGALGNNFPFDPELRTLWEIAVQVESVNDPPVIGRLEAVIKDTVAVEENSVDLWVFEERALNASEHYVLVDEDQFYTFNHTLLWVSDLDSHEAQLISGKFKSSSIAAQQRSSVYA